MDETPRDRRRSWWTRSANADLLWGSSVGLGAVGLLLSSLISTASAQTPSGSVVESLSGPQLRDVLQEAGYRAELSKATDGTPRVRSAAAGSNFTVLFYQCDDAKEYCDQIQFFVAFGMTNKPDFKKINEWNKTRRWAKVYLDGEGDPVIQYDVSVQGVTRPYLLRTLRRWELILGTFKDYIGF